MIAALSRWQKSLLLIWTLGVLVLNFVFIPLHIADDDDHLGIAYAAAHFRFGPEPTPDPNVSSGTWVDAAIPEFVRKNFDAAHLQAPPQPSRTKWTGRQVYHPLPASVYLPIVYLPQSIAVRLGEATGMSVEQTINLARVANGLTAIAIVALAIGLLPEGLGVFALILLFLPKSLLVFASNSADPIDHAITIAIVAFFCRVLTTPWQPKPWHYALASLGVLALGGVRPPLAAIGLLVLYAAWHRRSGSGMALALAGMILSLAWWGLVLPTYHDLRCPVTSTITEKALHFVTNSPALMTETLAVRGSYYWGSFIGELGYGDARVGYFRPLPMFVYALATVILVLGFAALGKVRLAISPLARWTAIIAALSMIAGIFFSLSIACTAFGAPVIEGVQGRYFVTPLLLLAVAGAALLPRQELCERLVRKALPLFLLVNLAVLVTAGIRLYWLV